MIDILLISDQTRLHDIVSAVGKLPDGTLRIASGLDQALSEIKSGTPDMILLQNRLSGLSSFILVRHVREQAGSAKIVLLTDGMEGNETSSADIELLTGVADNELSDAISEIIGDQLALQNEGRPRHATGSDTLPRTGHASDVTDNVSLSSTKAIAPSASTGPQPDRKLPAPATEDNGPISRATILNSTPPPLQWEKRRLAVAITVVAILSVAAVLGGILFRSQPPAVPRKAVAPAALPAAPPVQAMPSSATRKGPSAGITPVAPLPSFIPAAGKDPAYSRENPGWERYTSSKREYKIYSDSGRLKAIQVLDRQPGGVTTRFFTKVLREIAKSERYDLVSSETKGEYLMKKGKLSPTAEIILYKNRSDTLLRAFVVYFTDQGDTPDTKGPNEPHR